MAIKALSKVSPDWYTPDGEKESDHPTRFKIRPLTPPEREALMEHDGKAFVVPAKNYNDVLRLGIVEYDNFQDEHGKPIKCNAAGNARLPIETRIELALEILNRSALAEDEEKN